MNDDTATIIGLGICMLLLMTGVYMYQHESISEEEANQINACLESIARTECAKYNQKYYTIDHVIFGKTYSEFYCKPNQRLTDSTSYYFLDEDYKNCGYDKK